MIYNLTQIKTENFINWCDQFKKKLNHEHIALYVYIHDTITIDNPYTMVENGKKYFLLNIMLILTDFRTVRTRKALLANCEEIAKIKLIEYELVDNDKYLKVYLAPLPYFFLCHDKFSKLSSKEKNFVSSYVKYINSYTQSEVYAQLRENDEDSPEILELMKRTFRIENLDYDFTHVYAFMVDYLLNVINLVKNTFDLTEQMPKVNKVYLTEDEFNLIYPIIFRWNKIAKETKVLTVHKINDYIDKPVSKTIKKAAYIFCQINDQNYDDIPDPFKVFEEHALSIEQIKKAIEEYASIMVWKNMKTKASFTQFLYNPMNNSSWLCKLIKFPTPNFRLNNQLKPVYSQYESLLRKKGDLTNDEKTQIILIVNNLHAEFKKIKKTVGWYHKSIKNTYQFNSWDAFSKEHMFFLKSEYKKLNINILKPILYDGRFSRSYKKFIDFIADNHGYSLYPSVKEMKLLLQHRKLTLLKDKEISEHNSSLTPKEYEQYKRNRLELLYDDNS